MADSFRIYWHRGSAVIPETKFFRVRGSSNGGAAFSRLFQTTKGKAFTTMV